MKTATDPQAPQTGQHWIKDPNGAFGAWDRWAGATGLPIHQGYFIPDLRTVELGWWEERQCHGAFLKLSGQEGVSEGRISEIPAGQTLPPLKFSIDEAVYVVEGRGLTSIWREAGGQTVNFEWQKHSLFRLPRHHYHQLSNVQGGSPARLLHFNYLPITMQSIPDPEFFFNNPYVGADDAPSLSDLYSAAQTMKHPFAAEGRSSNIWAGNFFPDMRAWDRLSEQGTGVRGAGARGVSISLPGSPITAHMAVFPPFTYKKAHRHGPGVVIVIPAGEGFSVMWPEGQDKVMIPWHEASVFVPPNRWFHQHFNVGDTPARYLAMHALPGLSTYSERVDDLARDQIEYPDEDPWIRQMFEAELAKRNLTSHMPEGAYLDRAYKFTADDQP
jgi:hypothetical protein